MINSLEQHGGAPLRVEWREVCHEDAKLCRTVLNGHLLTVIGYTGFWVWTVVRLKDAGLVASGREDAVEDAMDAAVNRLVEE